MTGSFAGIGPSLSMGPGNGTPLLPDLRLLADHGRCGDHHLLWFCGGVRKVNMRRYRARLRSGSTLAAMTLGWDPKDRRYVCEMTSANGDVRRENFDHLRDVIHQLRWDAVIDDTMLRALLKDRGGTRSATGTKP